MKTPNSGTYSEYENIQYRKAFRPLRKEAKRNGFSKEWPGPYLWMKLCELRDNDIHDEWRNYLENCVYDHFSSSKYFSKKYICGPCCQCGSTNNVSILRRSWIEKYDWSCNWLHRELCRSCMKRHEVLYKRGKR